MRTRENLRSARKGMAKNQKFPRSSYFFCGVFLTSQFFLFLLRHALSVCEDLGMYNLARAQPGLTGLGHDFTAQR